MIVRFTLERLDKMTDAGIDYSDIPELDDDFFERAGLATRTQPEKP